MLISILFDYHIFFNIIFFHLLDHLLEVRVAFVVILANGQRIQKPQTISPDHYDLVVFFVFQQQRPQKSQKEEIGTDYFES